MSRYDQIIEKVFFNNYKEGTSSFTFHRSELQEASRELAVNLPSNLGDLIYSYRYRALLPESIRALSPQGKEWLIKLSGKGVYTFSLENILSIVPNPSLAYTKILDSTPGLIRRYSLNDEQALLAVLRYNRLIDIFLGITCYSLQNHLRTTVTGIGQIETDEIYIGVDKKGVQYVVPVQAKGGMDKQGKVQIEQDLELCKTKFPNLICIPIAAQFMANNTIALFAFELVDDVVRITSERHYTLVEDSVLSKEDLISYQLRP